MNDWEATTYEIRVNHDAGELDEVPAEIQDLCERLLALEEVNGVEASETKPLVTEWEGGR